MTESEFRDFVQEMILRFDRIADAIRSDVQAQRAETRRLREEMRLHFAEQRRKTDEIIAEGKAQRAALFSMMDRLGKGGGAATAG